MTATNEIDDAMNIIKEELLLDVIDNLIDLTEESPDSNSLI